MLVMLYQSGRNPHQSDLQSSKVEFNIYFIPFPKAKGFYRCDGDVFSVCVCMCVCMWCLACKLDISRRVT